MLYNYSKVSVGNIVYNLRIYNGEQIIDTPINSFPNTVAYLLQKSNEKFKDKNV